MTSFAKKIDNILSIENAISILEIWDQQGKSEGFNGFDWPTNLTQIQGKTDLSCSDVPFSPFSQILCALVCEKKQIILCAFSNWNVLKD